MDTKEKESDQSVPTGNSRRRFLVKTASILGLSKSSLYRKMEELGIGFSTDPSQK